MHLANNANQIENQLQFFAVARRERKVQTNKLDKLKFTARTVIVTAGCEFIEGCTRSSSDCERRKQ